MTYQIECGHCREMISLPEDAMGRSVPCPACGGMLAVVSPVPTIPAVPAPAELDFPSLKRDTQLLADAKPDVRARYLNPPWPTVRRGLFLSLYALHVAMILYVALLVGKLVLVRLDPPGVVGRVVERAVLLLVIAQVVPILFHAAGQWCCAHAPRSHGSRLVGASVALQVCSALALMGYPLVGVYAVAGSVLLMLAAYGVWLTFLSRVARNLRDPLLARRAWSYASLFWSGLAMAAALAAGAFLGTLAGGSLVVWLCHAAAGAIGLVLLTAYRSLLNTALRGVARYAPV
jgi:hypothetical protein